MFHGNITPEIARGLKELQARIKAANIPSSKLDETLNIATWNIREFGKKPRSQAAIHYIAEVLGQFDLIALVELNDDVRDLGRVLPILGKYWRVVYSDVIPDRGGNEERMAYLYDTRAVQFAGLAAEVDTKRTKVGAEYVRKVDWYRNPYIASFHSGNFDFMAITAHVRWQDEASRTQELMRLADWIDVRRKDEHCEDRDIIVMGDFNVPAEGDPMFDALTHAGLVIPDALRGREFGSNLEKNKRYDQILHYPIYAESFTNRGGILDFYRDEIDPLFPGMSKPDFTYQMSDHLPLWVQINTDLAGRKLDQILLGAAPAKEGVRRPRRELAGVG